MTVTDVMIRMAHDNAWANLRLHRAAMLAGTRVKPPQLDEFFLHQDLSLREAELRELGLPVR